MNAAGHTQGPGGGTPGGAMMMSAGGMMTSPQPGSQGRSDHSSRMANQSGSQGPSRGHVTNQGSGQRAESAMRGQSPRQPTGPDTASGSLITYSPTEIKVRSGSSLVTVFGYSDIDILSKFYAQMIWTFTKLLNNNSSYK